MPIIGVSGQKIDVDIRTELESFPWIRPRWATDKLIAASPFRYDHTPSFMVNLDGQFAGTFKDSGAYDADWESGNFAKLLAFLRDETYEETCEYLLDSYGGGGGLNSGDNKFELPTLHMPKAPRKPAVLASDKLNGYRFRHPYLGRRGISEKVQLFMDVGFRKDAQAVTIPWRHVNGELANVKYRKVRGKAFWYERGAEPIRNLVYGLDKVYAHNLGEVWICEAEIDAMSAYVLGQPAVAIGGASVSERQLELIRKSPISSAVIATDNDKAGEKVKRQLIEGLRGYVRLREIAWGETGKANVKDVNEALVGGKESLEVRNVDTLTIGRAGEIHE